MARDTEYAKRGTFHRVEDDTDLLEAQAEARRIWVL